MTRLYAMTRLLIVLFTFALLATGCSGPKRSAGGGYYKDDGPGTRQVNIHAIPDARPRIEPHAPANMRPYRVFGRQYIPITAERPFRQKGIASWYGRKFHGKKTANGEIYDMYAMTAAHPTLPLPSYARVTHAKSGKSVIVRINDRGPFHSSRIIDLSYVAAAKLDLIGPGSGPVIVEAITHDDIRQNAWQRGGDPAPEAMPIPPAPPRQSPPTLTVQSDVDALDALSAPETQIAAHSTPEARNAHDVRDVPDARDAGSASATAMVVADSRPHTPEDTKSDSNATAVFLQFGAFSAHDNARRLAESLNLEIAPVEHRRAHVNSADNLHRVHVGPYSNRAQAVNAALRIQAATGRQATYAILPASDDTDRKPAPLSL
ncbi:MAG TPA: septal ring lytic transglycosylase RlpA family protein [Burkholderiaceae bacterium]|nr:septal ring lytic transglycosylase RlpA family protein [Burkholderiaceae bacterium]